MNRNELRELRAAGDSVRADRVRRTRVYRRSSATGGLIVLLLATAAMPIRPLLVWNASASAPIGLYGVTRPQHAETGEMVIARLPPLWASFAASRHYLPTNVLLVKRVAAAAGDTVCATGSAVSISGRIIAVRRRFDARGRPLAWWQGCVVLRDGAVFLLNNDPGSFDGRYTGLTQHDAIVGRAHPLWTR